MPLFSILLIAIDQLLKFTMLRVLDYGDSIPIIKGFFSLTLVYNTGAAFGILEGRRGLFLVLPILTAVLILVLYIRSREKNRLLVPLGLILSGTIGNFIDRLRFGYVIDFFDLYYQSWHWPAFNIADSCICFGVLLFFLQMTRPVRGRASNGVRRKDASSPN